MSPHPFTESFIKKATGTALAILAAAVLWLLLTLYGNLNVLNTLVASAAYVFLLSLAGYLYWYIIDYIPTFVLRVLIAVVVQLVCIAGTFAAIMILETDEPEVAVAIFPLCFVYGLLCLIVLNQWYHSVKDRLQMQQIEENCRKESMEPERGEVIDRISVKEGVQIHIVRLEELLYLQAYGDYVMLFTDKGKYIKEQTMKYFEMHLPLSFVRIHRSCIVNTEKITRVELFGKESYNVYLKNGTSVRASTTGYKLLKEKLLL
ncbi:MAG: hypothetical protein A2X18_02695 [Bacteroidetes bacterium GWF2_40_14]|nr:MAG: hypothetical protein A2X18_02695 [Bacteroidetes bacterium GWF2_40_14]